MKEIVSEIGAYYVASFINGKYIRNKFFMDGTTQSGICILIKYNACLKSCILLNSVLCNNLNKGGELWH